MGNDPGLHQFTQNAMSEPKVHIASRIYDLLFHFCRTLMVISFSVFAISLREIYLMNDVVVF